MTTIKRPQRFCYLTPPYPKVAYVCIVYIYRHKKLIDFMPMPELCSNISEIKPCMNIMIESLDAQQAKEVYDVSVSNMATIIPITFKHLHPLKKEHWHKSSWNDNSKERRLMFINMIMDNYQSHNLVVVPQSYVNNKWGFCATFPHRSIYSHEVVDKYILNSDEPIAYEAKYAAIYSVGKPFRYDRDNNIIFENQLKLENIDKSFN